MNRRAVQDTLEVISGKWKLIVLLTLENRSYRFRELAREISITPRMLSSVLLDLEQNHLVQRTSSDSQANIVYVITEYGLTFHHVIDAMRDWGIMHRKKILT